MPLRSCSSVIGTACHVSVRGSSRHFDAGASLRRVRIVGRSAPGRPVAAIVGSEAASAAAAEHVREVEDRPVVAPEREVVGVAVGDRAGRVDRLRAHHAADDAQALARGDRQARREAGRDREIGGVHHGEEHAALAHERPAGCATPLQPRPGRMSSV